MSNIKIEYIYHSCYTIETDRYFFIFDYFEGNLNIPQNKQTVFVVSHGHSDHYTSNILKLPNFEDNIYIMSSDIKDLDKEDNIIFLSKEGNSDLEELKRLYRSPNVHFYDPYEGDRVAEFEFHTFGSTDLGFSILIELDGINYFHAGDLTFWDWPDFSQEEKKREYEDYIYVLDRLKDYNVDIAFVPVDPRLGENYYEGGEIFIEKIKPQILFPMHFEDNYYISRDFKNKIGKQNTEIRTINNRNESITIDINVV